MISKLSNSELNRRVAEEVIGVSMPERWMENGEPQIGAKPYCEDISLAFAVEDRIATLELGKRYSDGLLTLISAEKGGASLFDLAHATPRQRCEAALNAVNGKAK